MFGNLANALYRADKNWFDKIQPCGFNRRLE
jgi:hypothetical protein